VIPADKPLVPHPSAADITAACEAYEWLRAQLDGSNKRHVIAAMLAMDRDACALRSARAEEPQP
jgi:hypothetical protein